MRWDFVGRVDELAALEAAWLAVEAGGAGPVVVVYGEPGIGKTRIVSEFASTTLERGAEVLWGTCYEGGDSYPYAVWAEAIRGYVERLGGDGLDRALGGDVRWLAPLLPDLALIDFEPVSAPAGVAQVRVAEVLARLLDSLERQPVVVIDDMQWAHPDSLEVFGHVARLATGSLVVVSCRGTALELDHPLARRLAEVQRHRSCEYVALGSLPRIEAGQLLEQVAGEPLAASLIDAVYVESGGNPFFLGELALALQRDAGNALAEGRAPVLPESVRGAVGLRLAGLSAQGRQVLQLASVFTAGFGFTELQALTGVEDDSLLDCLDQALAEGLVFSLDAERYDFAHALVRQTLYESLSPSRRARVHRRLAEALERLHQRDLPRVAGELVRQYHASAALAGAVRGARFALIAAQVARAAGAPADAVMVLRLALDLVGAKHAELQAQVLSELARAEADAHLFQDAASTLEAAFSALEREGASAESIAELVYTVGREFTFAVAIESLQSIEPLIAHALEGVGQAHSLAWARLKLLDRYARPAAAGTVRAPRPVRLDQEAVRIVRTEGTEADYAETLNGWDPSFGAEIARLIPELDAWQDPVARLRALIHVLGYLTLLKPGSSPAADRLTVETVALADDVGTPDSRGLARVLRAAQLGGRGEFDAAAEQLRQARAVFEQEDRSSALLTVVDVLNSQHVDADWPRVAMTMWDLAKSPREAEWLGLVIAPLAAHAFARAGEVDTAREILESIVPALESAELLDPPAIGLAGEAVWELRAKDLAQRLLPHASALSEADGHEFHMTSNELTVARLSAVVGSFDQAVDYFARARVTLEYRDQRVLRAIVDYDEAVARLAQKQPGAARLLADASARFEQLGMHEWSGRVKLVEVTDELPDQLTAREAEILRLVAVGKSNKQIATELVISVHTVERHIQNAYRKVDARNRAQASSYVARVRL
ncbi:MAG TPA: AAA family ATPase [Solirubrobacteraceae bacterium]|nr:AAA family ATPase [Solirubrobacteraceae bacterium]